MQVEHEIQADDWPSGKGIETVVHCRDIVPHFGGVAILRDLCVRRWVLPEQVIQGGPRAFDA